MVKWQVALVKSVKAFQEDKIEAKVQQIFSQYPLPKFAVRDWPITSFGN